MLKEDHGLTIDNIQDMLEYPKDASMGDLALPCFKLSKTLHAAPPIIAEKIADQFICDGISETNVVGGYLNFTVDQSFALSVINRVLLDGKRYGASEVGKGKVVVLDYSSPNVAKPFHIGHLGTTVIGHSLKKMHEFAGYQCVGINYLGDWGTQFGKLITAYKLWGSKEAIEQNGIDELVSLYVRINQAAEQDESLNERARAEFKKLEQQDEENISLWKWFIEISLAEYEKTYKQLDITFDSYKGESFYTDKMPAQVQKLRDEGLLKQDDGASIVDLSAYNMPPCLILKRDGSTLYPTRDIAAAVYRKETYHFDKAIYVTSAGQSLHFAQWFKVVELMGYDWYSELVHVPYGTVSINGAKLATRTGNVILLRDLFAQAIAKASDIMKEKNPDDELDEKTAEAVGVGAIIFHYLSNTRIKDINFIMEDVLSFEGNTGPYAQYTYARACSVLKKSSLTETDYEISTAEEMALAKVLSQFEERVMQALEEYEPYLITRYILEVCSAFNRFYHACKIVSAEDEKVRNTRLRLTAAAKQVLENAMHLICMKTPEKI
ncbi:MAG: arginine--tRNA ligase [Clostridiales bacterium]|nr:arginine--tRNA ligase [Clostridiales bacterium]